MTESELRRRLGMEVPFAWLALREAYQSSVHEPIILNQGTQWEEPFGPSLTVEWAARLWAAGPGWREKGTP